MKIAVLGTGIVGQTHAEKLAGLGHDVVVGTRDPKSKELKGLKVASFSSTAKHSRLIIEALNGQAAVEVLSGLKAQLAGKVLIDISNPLDFSKGYLRLSVSNDDSLGEQIQKVLPKTKVVKAFNTTNVSVQIDPGNLAKGDHHLFIAGNDKTAKAKVAKFAREQYGWKNIIDLGDIKAARGLEMIMPLWLQLMHTVGTSQFNFKITK